MATAFKLPPGERFHVEPGDASSSVRSLDYDAAARRLEVVFTSGERYAYWPVLRGEFEAMLASGSIGGYLNTRIKPNCQCEHLPPPRPGKARGRRSS